MDLVKRGRNKLQEGVCVSLPTSYWGSAYATLADCEHLYGRIKGIDQFSRFTVEWDIDGGITQGLSLNSHDERILQ